jgi:hypothetical protein
MGYFIPRGKTHSQLKKLGSELIELSENVFKAGTEWEKFDNNTKAWISKRYRFDGTRDGTIPDKIQIIPVYDTPTKMHVRIPWYDRLVGLPTPGPEENASFEEFYARYFIRSCR